MKILCKLARPFQPFLGYDYAAGGYRYGPEEDEWHNTRAYGMFAACCGANYVEETDEKTKVTTGKGIRVYAGHVGRGRSRTPKNEYKHINTKNGPLTVAIRKEL